MRGSVSGWEFKAYVLGPLFYRFISEKLETSINAAEHRGGNKSFVYGDLTDANIDVIFKLYTDSKTVKYKARLVPYEEIAKNGFNLSVATYVDTTPPAPPKDLKAIGARVKVATKETDKCRAAVDKILKELT